MTMTIAIESDPGSNITSQFLKFLDGDRNIRYHREPLYNWKYYSLLEDFWKDITSEEINTTSSTFLVLVKSIFDKYNRIISISNSTIENSRFNKRKANIFERSIFTDFYVLTNTLRSLKKISDIEYDIIKSLYKHFETRTSVMNYSFYIKTPAIERTIQNSKVSPEFIKEYQKHMENYFQSGNQNVKIFDWDGTEEGMEKIANNIKNIIDKNYKKF